MESPGLRPLLSCPLSFSLDKDTGVILLTARLDFETTQRYTLTIIARDGGGEETTGRVRINILDVNDNVPTFQKEAYLGALRENEPSVTQVVRLRVRDRSGSSARNVWWGDGCKLGPHPSSYCLPLTKCFVLCCQVQQGAVLQPGAASLLLLSYKFLHGIPRLLPGQRRCLRVALLFSIKSTGTEGKVLCLLMEMLTSSVGFRQAGKIAPSA